METPILNEHCTILELREWIEATAKYADALSAACTQEGIREQMADLIRATDAEQSAGGMEWTLPHLAVFLFLMESASNRHGWNEESATMVLMPMLSGLPRAVQAAIDVDMTRGALRISQ